MCMCVCVRHVFPQDFVAYKASSARLHAVSTKFCYSSSKAFFLTTGNPQVRQEKLLKIGNDNYTIDAQV